MLARCLHEIRASYLATPYRESSGLVHTMWANFAEGAWHELPRTPIWRTSEKNPSTHSGEQSQYSPHLGCRKVGAVVRQAYAGRSISKNSYTPPWVSWW